MGNQVESLCATASGAAKKQSFCKMVKNPAIKYGSRMASAVARFIESRIGLSKPDGR